MEGFEREARGLLSLALLTAVAAAPRAWAQADAALSSNVLHVGFEGKDPSWTQEETDATFLLRAHERTDENVREGRMAERFVFEVGPGSALYYGFSLPHIPVTGRLGASLQVRSNRTGIRLYGVVVLPRDRDPETGKPWRIIVSGTAIDAPDRWQRLELSGILLAVEEQARVLRAGTERKVELDGAYLDRVLVNLYGGAGATEVLIDDLNVAPVPPELIPTDGDEPEPAATGAPVRPSEPKPRVTLSSNRLQKDGAFWFPKAISAPGADLSSLRRSGVDLLEVPLNTDAESVEVAAQLGYLLLPTIGARANEPAEDLLARLDTFPRLDTVAFWNIGEGLGRADDPIVRRRELEAVRQLISRMRRDRGSDKPRLSLGSVSDLFPQYALFGRHLDIIGVEIPGIGSGVEPLDTFRWLTQKRALTAAKNPNAIFWAWIPAAAAPSLRSSVWGDDVPPVWGWPNVQADQIRMFTYAALSAGYRGIAFRGDVELARPGGLDRLYELTLLVAEIELVQGILARGAEPIAQWPAFPPDPKRALIYNSTGTVGMFAAPTRNEPLKEVAALPSIRVAAIDTDDHRTKLLIVTDYAQGGQHQAPQMGYRQVSLLVPATESAQAFEVSLADVEALESRRDAGGRRVTLPVFNGTALVLLTSDMALVEEIRRNAWALRARAVDIALKQAELRVEEAVMLNGILASQGTEVRNANDLLDEARSMLAAARDARDRQDYSAAWIEARSIGQPVRMVLRAHWDRALADFWSVAGASLAQDAARAGEERRPSVLVTAVSCPPLLSARTVPQYNYWREFVRGGPSGFGANRVPTGAFEASAGALREAGWTDGSHPVDGLEATTRVDTRQGWGPRRGALKLTVLPSELPAGDDFRDETGKVNQKQYDAAVRRSVDSVSPIQDHPVAAVRSPAIPVRARDFVRVRVLVKMPRAITSGSKGLIVRDSLGGELLQFRTTEAITDWREVVLYRRVPEDGEISVLLGLAGQGIAYFDDLRIEVLGDAPSSGPRPGRSTETDIAGDLAPPSPSLPVSGNGGARR